MKAAANSAVLSAIFATGTFAQTPPPASPVPRPIQISSRLAEKLLLHKVEVCYPPRPGSRVTGTVVVAIEIDKNGNVLHPTVVSGPAMLQASVVDAVEKHYNYRPYLVNGWRQM
jgi:outer membrane biosynthesis protein TonB